MDAAKAADNDPTNWAPRAQPRSLSRRVLSGGGWSLAGRVGSMGSLFLLNVVLARSLSKAEYSAFLTAASVVPLLAMLATLGVPYTLVRVLRAEICHDRQRLQAVRGALTLTAVGSAATAAAYWYGARFFPVDDRWQVVGQSPWLVSGWFVLSALCMVSANYLQGVDNFRAAALVGARSGGLIPNALALVGACGAALAGFLTLGAILNMQLAAYLVALAAAAWFIGRPLSADFAAPTAAAQPGAPQYNARWYFVECWPNLLNQLIAVALVELDLFWIACLSNEETVASYGVIRNLRLLVTAPLLVASVALPPFVAELFGRGDLARLERLIRGAATALALPSLAALVVLLLAPEEVIGLVYGEAFADAALGLQIVSLGAIVFVLTGSNAMTLTMTGRHRDLLVCGVSCLAFYLAISPPLVSRYGVVGAATAYALQTAVLNIIVTVRVKQTVGLWTIPLLSWTAARQELTQLVQRLKQGR